MPTVEQGRPSGPIMPHTTKGAAMDHPPFSLAGIEQTAISLGPDEAFPADLAGLGLVELQVLHSRVCHQLDHEYLAGLDGPHPLTLDRCRELVAELEARARPARRAAS